LFGDKREKLAELQVHQRKLSELVSGLLEKADQLDRDVQERQRKLSHDWRDSFAKTCQEAVHLSEVVSGIESLLKKGDVRASEKALNRSADIAIHLHEKLSDLARGAK
jgi:hypothetical protein